MHDPDHEAGRIRDSRDGDRAPIDARLEDHSRERRVSTEEDSVQLDRLVGGRTVPSLAIGAQVLRGLSESDWQSYLDAAGYPRDNKLPRNWTVPAPTPLAERVTPAARAAEAPPTVPVLPYAEPPSSGGVRF